MWKIQTNFNCYGFEWRPFSCLRISGFHKELNQTWHFGRKQTDRFIVLFSAPPCFTLLGTTPTIICFSLNFRHTWIAMCTTTKINWNTIPIWNKNNTWDFFLWTVFYTQCLASQKSQLRFKWLIFLYSFYVWSFEIQVKDRK